jgi:hypothetical protein
MDQQLDRALEVSYFAVVCVFASLNDNAEIFLSAKVAYSAHQPFSSSD